MNIYNITKGQLIILWIFGIVGELSLADSYYYGFMKDLFLWLIPAFLIFYTLGWLNRRKSSKVEL